MCHTGPLASWQDFSTYIDMFCALPGIFRGLTGTNLNLALHTSFKTSRSRSGHDRCRFLLFRVQDAHVGFVHAVLGTDNDLQL